MKNVKIGIFKLMGRWYPSMISLNVKVQKLTRTVYEIIARKDDDNHGKRYKYNLLLYRKVLNCHKRRDLKKKWYEDNSEGVEHWLAKE